MSNLHRYLKKYVDDDLKHKMVFIGGPRQVGKTTLALSLLKDGNLRHPAYLNWDNLVAKAKIRNGDLPFDEPLIVLDEVHKFVRWRNLIKGFFDTRRADQKFIVTGSARLDYYRRGGDSLMGRYHYYRLHPLSVSELGIQKNSEVEALLKFGGFPEPFYRAEEVFAKRWRRERLSKIVNEDIQDLENLKELSLMEALVDDIPQFVGSQLSFQGIANHLEVSFKTIQNWISILDNMYLTFRISPYCSGKIKLIKKTQRIFMWDWGGLENKGAQFENFVGSHLLKFCHFTEDIQGDKMELRYLRDTEGREIDFLVLKNRKPFFAVECKTGERGPSEAIYYFKKRLSIPMIYQVHLGSKHYSPEAGIEIIPFVVFCKKLNIP